MRKLGFVCIAAGLLLIAGSALLAWREARRAPLPAAVAQLERSLARPGLLGLATLDVAALAQLGVDAEAMGDGLAGELRAAGIDLRGDVDYATLALSASPDGVADVVFALFGRFDPAAIERALRGRDDLEVSDAEAAGVPLLHVVRIDRDSCRESGPWAVRLGAERVLVAGPDAIADLLAGDAASDAALRDLARFQAFREGRVVSAAFFVPEDLPRTSNPFVGMAAQGAKQQVEGFRAVYAGAGTRLLPPGLAVDAVLEGVRPGLAAEKATAWQGWLDQRLAGIGEKAPVLASLREALALRAQGNDLQASFVLSRGDLERLTQLPDELVGLVFGDGALDFGAGEASGGERLAQDAPVFRSQVSREDLSDYDPEVTFAEPVDRVSGPFGLRLSALRLLRDGEHPDATGEIEVEAFATHLPNLGSSGDRASLRITRVESADGEDLLAAERCGPERGELPAPLANHFGGELLRGSKSVRLREGASPHDVVRVAGVASVRLPTRTEVVRMPAEPGVVERAGARLEIQKLQGGSVSYRVSGDADRLLQLRALNAAGRALADEGASSMNAFGGTRATESFAGSIHALEAVFALEEEDVSYPFELSSLRPGSAGELVASEPDAGAVGAVRIRGAFPDWLSRVAAPVSFGGSAGDDADTPVTRAGPFALRLEGLWPFGGLMPRIEVRAPAVPGLAESPGAIELALSELHLLDGTVQRGDWRETLSMSQEFGGEALVATSQLDTGVSASPNDVASLHGSVRIRLPVRVRSAPLGPATLGASFETPALSLRLVELGRDRFVLRASRGGERLLGARAFNAGDQPLFTQHAGSETTADGALEASFQVRGVPRRIEVRVAEELAEAGYPFVLRSADRTVARAR